MEANVSFQYQKTSLKASDFSDSDFGENAVRLLNNLFQVVGQLRQHKVYCDELMASGEAGTDYGTMYYGGMFGADDCLPYHNDHSTEKFFKTFLDTQYLATAFYGINLNPLYKHENMPSDYYSDKYPKTNDWTPQNITLNPEFWYERSDQDGNYYAASDYPKNSLYWDYRHTDTLTRRVRGGKLFEALCYVQQIFNIMRDICGKATVSQGGLGSNEPYNNTIKKLILLLAKGGLGSNEPYNNTFAKVASRLYMIQPALIPRLRQALAWLTDTQVAGNDYDMGNICDHISDYYFGEYDPDYDLSYMEIDDQTYDYGVYSYSGDFVPISDPLCLQGEGWVGMLDKNGNPTRVLGFELARKMIIPSYNVATDYKEETNPNAYRASNGKANYKQSNVRQWANYEGQSTSSWKIKQHEYDDFFSGTAKPYLTCISDILRANIAKVIHPTYIPKDTGAITNNSTTNANNRALELMEDRVWLPLMKNFGITNSLTNRKWTNFQLDIDPDISQVSGLSGKASMEYAENNWAWASNTTYRRKIKLNTNSKSTRITTATNVLIPCRVAGTKSTAGGGDSTIATHIAGYYLNKTDGTATNDQMGAQAPYSYAGWLFCFTIVPFHIWKTNTNLLRDKCCGVPHLPYTAK